MNPEITDDQLAVWKVSLALRLRQLLGDAFQDFFAEVMRFTGCVKPRLAQRVPAER